MDNIDLYAIPVDPTALDLIVPCGGNLGGGGMESCVEIALIPGTTDAYVLQDNKAGAPGTQLRFSTDELDRFAEGWMNRQQ